MLLVIALAVAAVANGCQVGEWTKWGDCVRSPVCSSTVPGRSWPMEAEAGEDEGRKVMKTMMYYKQMEAEKRRKCRAEGTCPELYRPKREGYVPCVGGMSGWHPCSNLDQVSFLNIADLSPLTPNVEANDLWAWTDPQNGDEYVIIGLASGTSFVRITPNPEVPVVVGFLPTHTSNSDWRDMKVVNDHAYIVSEARDHGMQVFDLARLRGVNAFELFTEDYHYDLVGNSHNIIANQDTQRVYIVGATSSSYPLRCNAGLHAIDVSIPKEPQFIGCFSDDGYTHDAQCVIYSGPDTQYYGSEICFCYNENSFTIVDVTDEENFYMISKESYNGAAYTHQGWLTEDMTVALMDDEADEQRALIDKRTRTYMWDVTNLEIPIHVSTFMSTETSIDHNQYVLGNFTYQANYQAGLRILNIDQEWFDLAEVAYFDVFPTGTAANFNGAWSTYPYFASGIVPVSSIEYGLYLLSPNWFQINADLKNQKVHGHQIRNRPITAAKDGDTCPAVEERKQCMPDAC